MSEFRTKINIPKSDFKINHEDKIFLIGSCFSDNIGQQLYNSGFNVEINSFGTLYNPVSISNSLKIITRQLEIKKDDLVFHEDLWKSFYHYSSFNSANETALISKINDKINYVEYFLKSSKYLVITFGTAWVYRYLKTNKIVSNCHKIPSNEFSRELLTVAEIIETYTELINSLIKYNPELKVIFSVSPIRHLKDGNFGNQVSKSTLILAINSLIKNFSCCSYFPAYEIFMDDLRAYRFYADDMIHPSQIGVNYVWEKFIGSLMSKETIQIIAEVEKLNKAVTHRVIDKNSESYQKFITQIKAKVNELEKNNPRLNLESIKRNFNL
ncbi:MAG: hypothetical protein A2033_10900 [Bacteroidetes bacterium GWA2_31_9]|nr:MAG: hypothetical protein A2033_10900 [Bacteroidetes bacterium GWA2_31_9]